jgi:PhzF family phenazine biosynthesis protein
VTSTPADGLTRWAAFSADPDGGNPAGVVLDARGLDDAEMQATALAVGYAETAFVVGPDLDGDGRRHRVRYFSPVAEVPFCGHATVATAIALAERDGPGRVVVETGVGPVSIETALDADGGARASFTSPEPRVEPVAPDVLDRLLRSLGLAAAALDPARPVLAAWAGNLHPVLPVVDRAAFDDFVVDPVTLRPLMDEQGWTGTVTVVHELGVDDDGTLVLEARNPFPVGTLSEDPATGSAAAALGGWLRASGRVSAPARVRVHQGAHVGRPGVLDVVVPATGGIVVSGRGVRIDGPRGSVQGPSPLEG